MHGIMKYINADAAPFGAAERYLSLSIISKNER
jgi:hypothetical protein